jgi:hypothetical protein
MIHGKLGRPPIEPLSDVTRARIEQGLWARLDLAAPTPSAVTNRRWLWIGLPALAAAAAIALFVIGPWRTSEPIADGQPARLVSGSSPSSASFDDAHITLDANSAVVVSRDVRAPSALLERGGAWFSVAPRAGRAPFIVTAGDTIVRVVGTRFRVTRADERVSVEVEHGVVEVQFRGAKIAVSAGERWHSEKPTEVGTTRTAGAEPPPTMASPDRPLPAPLVDRAKRKTTESESKREPMVDVERAEFQRLTALEVRDPTAAITGYLALARGTSAWAEPALFAAARLAADRKEPLAQTLVEQYLERFPRGRNADDARRLLAHLKGVPR